MDQFIFVNKYAAEYITKKKGDPSDQNYLATLIDEGTEKKMLLAALMLVNPDNIISKREILINLMSHSVPNIRIKSLSKLVGMLGTDGTQIYVDSALDNPKFREKYNAVYHLMKNGDERAIPSMIKRLRSILNTRKSTPHLRNNKESELTDVISYLHKYVHDNNAVKKVFSRVTDKWDIMVPEEQQYLVTNKAYFSEQNVKSS